MKAVFGQCYRGLNQSCPGQFAVFLVCFPHSCNGAGNTRGFRAKQRVGRVNIAVFVQVHIARCGFWCHFSVVQKVRLTVDVDSHKAAAADVAGFRIGDRQRKLRSNGGINRIAALFQHVYGNLGAELVGHGYCVIGCGLFCRLV